MSTSDAAVDVGRLLAFALEVTAVPSESGVHADYGRLVQRYVENGEFRMLFDAVVEGAGCAVTTADRHVGIVLRTRTDGPWAWPARAADLPWNGKFEDAHQRAARALVAIALLAYVAPSAADFDELLADPDAVVTTVGVRDLERFIRDFCEHCEGDVSDPGQSTEHRPLWWHWLQLPAEAPTTARSSRGTTTYIVYDVLHFLQRTGWLIDTTSNRAASDKRYRPRRRLLHHYRDLLLDEVFAALQRHANSRRNTGESALDASTNENSERS